MRCWEIFKMHNKKIYLSPRLSTVVSRRHTSGRKDEKTFEYLITNTGPSISESIRWWKKESEKSKQQINFFPSYHLLLSALLVALHSHISRTIALCCVYPIAYAEPHRVPRAPSLFSCRRALFYVIVCDGLDGKLGVYFVGFHSCFSLPRSLFSANKHQHRLTWLA